MTDNEREDPTAVVAVEAEHRPRRSRSRSYLVVLSGRHVGKIYLVRDDVRVGRADDADIVLDDVGISRRHCLFRRDLDGNVTLIDLGSTNGSFTNGERVEKRKLTEGDQIQLGGEAVLKFTYHDEVEMEFQRRMYDSAVRDGLTGAFNKRCFSERLIEELSYAKRHKTPLTLTMLDIDRFKEFNDDHGHLAGDHVLRQVTQAIKRTIRKEDLLCRYGGEEFVVLSRGIALPDAEVMAERIRTAVADTYIEFQDKILRVTISAGIADAASLAVVEPEALIAAADEAMYRAKADGRNCVRLHQPPRS